MPELGKLRELARNLRISDRGNTDRLEKRIAKTLAKRLCSCEKAVYAKTRDIGRAIPICTSSVAHKKGLRIHGFRCGKSYTTKVVDGKQTRVTRKYAHLVKLPKDSNAEFNEHANKLFWFDKSAREEYDVKKRHRKTRKNKKNRKD